VRSEGGTGPGWRGDRHPVGRGRTAQAASAAAFALLASAAFLLAGCRTSGLIFTKDSAFRILSPSPSSSVTLPLKVTWTDGGPAAGAARFAVFLDQGTIRPGENLSSLLPDFCKVDPACPHNEYLLQQNVYVTSVPSLILTTLPQTTLGGHNSAREYHTLVVVLINSTGARVGEAFASTSFVYTRRGS
jgi:hypothetical protein